jgi:tetratricopeptide (TPR) repeat protein
VENGYKYVLCFLFVFITLSCHNGKENTTIVADKSNSDSLTTAIETLSTQIKSNPNIAAPWWQRGKLEEQEKKYVNALNDYRTAVKLDSAKDEYYYSLANVYFITGHTRDAKDCFEKCLSLNPDNTVTQLKLAELYLFVKQYKQSMDLLNKTIDVNPHQARAYFMKGLIFYEVRDTAKAISSFQTATEENPQYFEAFVQLGLLYAAKKKELALSYFNDAINIEPGNAEPWYDKGMFYQQEGDFDKAIASYNFIPEIDTISSYYVNSLYNLGDIYYEQQSDYKKAFACFAKFIAKDTGNSLAYYGRGLCYEHLQQKAMALKDYQKALKLNPRLNEAQESIKELKQ